MELWDIVDEHGTSTGRTHIVGTPMRDGEYHPSVSVWLMRGDGRMLISRRAQTDHAAGMWETTSGSILAGETAADAALREVREELGIALDPAFGRRWIAYTWPHSTCPGGAYIEVWIFRCEAEVDALILQPEETSEAAWATPDDIRARIRAGEFIPYDYIERLFAEIEESK